MNRERGPTVGENLKWLWMAFSVAWILHIGYVVLLSRRTSKLQRQLEHLGAQLTERRDDRP